MSTLFPELMMKVAASKASRRSAERRMSRQEKRELGQGSQASRRSANRMGSPAAGLDPADALRHEAMTEARAGVRSQSLATLPGRKERLLKLLGTRKGKGGAAAALTALSASAYGGHRYLKKKKAERSAA